MTYSEIKKMQDEMLQNMKKNTKDYVTRLKEAAKKRKEAKS